jgi:hypothetical protein
MNDDLLADLIAAVEQQLNSFQTLYVAETLSRLLKLGISRDEAVTEIALCLGEEMDQVLRNGRAFDESAYQTALKALPQIEEDTPPA